MPKKPVKENEKEWSETLDFNKPSFTFIPKGNHQWKQQGFYLVCKSCDLQHAVFIGPDKIMVGTDKEGQPILKSKKSIKGFLT